MDDSSASSTPFDFNAIPKFNKEQSLENALRARSEAVNAVALVAEPVVIEVTPGSGGRGSITAGESQSVYAQQLAEVPELKSYGPVLKSSSKPIELTESETEYVVACVKHIFAEHIVFQVGPFFSLFSFLTFSLIHLSPSFSVQHTKYR